MTCVEKVKFLFEERAEDLNDWEHDFISDLYRDIHERPEPATEEEVLEFFTPRQLRKLNEIWENLGL